jgi:cytoskeletal protein CcmA (bactofilin family)
MKKVKLQLLIFTLVATVSSVAAIFLAPATTNAAEIINRTEVFLFAEDTYDENLYVGAGKTIIESNVSEDLVVLGGEVTVNGKVAGDIFLMGGTVDFKGEVVGDLRVLGGEVEINGLINGDVLVIGGDIQILPDAVVNKEIFVVGGDVQVLSDINTDLKVMAGRVSLNSEISGPSEITTQDLLVGSEGSISGDFLYYAPHELRKDEGSVVIGNISYNEITDLRDNSLVKKVIVSFTSFWYLLQFITSLILAAVLVYVFRVFTQEVSDLALKSFWKSFLAGVLVAIFAIPILTLLTISLFALPVAVLLSMLIGFMMIISPAVSAIYLGSWAKQHLYNNESEEGLHSGIVDLKSAVVGLVILTILQFVPVFGGIIRFGLAVVAFGAIARYIRLAIVK